MRKLYYVVTKQLEDIDGFEEATGWKSIDVYEIKDNVPVVFAQLECANSDSSTEAITDYLTDNHSGLEEVELIQL
jgi:hypothetical protein